MALASFLACLEKYLRFETMIPPGTPLKSIVPATSRTTFTPSARLMSSRHFTWITDRRSSPLTMKASTPSSFRPPTFLTSHPSASEMRSAAKRSAPNLENRERSAGYRRRCVMRKSVRSSSSGLIGEYRASTPRRGGLQSQASNRFPRPPQYPHEVQTTIVVFPVPVSSDSMGDLQIAHVLNFSKRKTSVQALGSATSKVRCQCSLLLLEGPVSITFGASRNRAQSSGESSSGGARLRSSLRGQC